jgi:hypothetical protein
LDHIVIFNQRHLRRALSSYVDYYQSTRTHLSVDKDCPQSRPIQQGTADCINRYERLSATLGEKETDMVSKDLCIEEFFDFDHGLLRLIAPARNSGSDGILDNGNNYLVVVRIAVRLTAIFAQNTKSDEADDRGTAAQKRSRLCGGKRIWLKTRCRLFLANGVPYDAFPRRIERRNPAPRTLPGWCGKM